MGATVSRDLLADALSQVVRVVGTRSIVSELRIGATDNLLSITGTDGEHWIGLAIECEGEFDVCLTPAQKLHDVVQALVGETVKIDRAGGGLNLVCGRGRRSLGTLPVDQWLERKVEWPEPVTIEAAKLAEAIRFTLPCISRDDPSRAFLAGVHLIAGGGKLRALATDGFNTADISINCGGEFAGTISPKTADAILRISGTAELALTDRASRITWAGGYLEGPLVAGEYPVDLVGKMLARDYPDDAIIEATELLRGVRGVRPVGQLDTMSRSSRIKLSLDRDRITLETRSGEGSAEQEIPVSWEGEEMCLGFAAARMEKVLGCFGDAVLHVGIRNPQDPLKFTAAGQTDRVAMLYPMRV